jgi:hypothetical protein
MKTTLPRWLVTSLSTTGVTSKIEREFLVDHDSFSNVNLKGPEGWMQFELAGGNAPLPVDRITVQGRIRAATAPDMYFPSNQEQRLPQSSPGDWTCIVLGSDDGQAWKELGQATGQIPPPPPPTMFGRTAALIKMMVPFPSVSNNRIYRVVLKSTFEGIWYVNDVDFFNAGQPVEVGGPYRFTSAWMSEGKGEEWVYVDLGARCTFDRIALYWIRRPAESVLQTSDDAANWKDIVPILSTDGWSDELKLKTPVQGR